ncbi:MAG: ABC transporter ATP-binding protein [Deltaproteobacteria bacterium]|nr:ABC transporter ATP-binding protein [Deltaproteobacteria bacterium]
MTALEVRSLGRTFGGLKAVHRVSFRAQDRQIFGLIGPNGAGKTTVFNVVTGVYEPDEGGEVLLDSKRIDGLQPYQVASRGIARTFQNIRVFAEMSVVENVLVSAHMTARVGLVGAVFRTAAFRQEEKHQLERALRLLEIFKLDGLALEQAKNLPYGSQRKLEIARALMLGPKVLLLDEPAAGMNTGEADDLNEQIRWLRDEFELTIVLVEHNMRVVMGVCERIHVMDHGETIAEGTPEEIQKDRHVIAAYLGEDIDDG